MDFQRMMLWFALALVLVMLYERWIAYTTPPVPETAQVETTTAPGQAQTPAVDEGAIPGAPDVAPTTAETGASQSPAVNTPAVADEAPDENADVIQIVTDTLRASVSLSGADLVEVDLLQHAASHDQLDTPFALIKQTMTPNGLDVFVTQTGLIGRKGEFPENLPNHTTAYKSEQKEYKLADGQETLEVPFSYTSEDGVSYRKVYVFTRGSYAMDIRFEVDNPTDQDWNAFLYAQFQRTDAGTEGGFSLMRAAPSYLGGAIYTAEEKYEKIKFGDMDDAALKRNSVGGWVAMLQHYFVGAFLPKESENNVFYSSRSASGDLPRYHIGLKNAAATTVAAGSTGTLQTRLYLGPKERDNLISESEGLELSVDYGFLTPISEPLFWLMSKIHGIVGNWGWAIIFLTLLVKLVFFPLSAASYKSMAKMKKMQPRLQTLKERYGDDRQKLNQEMMTLYKKEKINPLGGCLPILVQIPVFIALYWVLLESVELRQAPFMLWIQDLSIKDPYFVLPIAMGASMVAQQFLNPAPMDPIQQKVMMALPIVFTFIFLWFPAGLVLYWLVNNVLSIGQQWYITRKLVRS